MKSVVYNCKILKLSGYYNKKNYNTTKFKMIYLNLRKILMKYLLNKILFTKIIYKNNLNINTKSNKSKMKIKN